MKRTPWMKPWLRLLRLLRKRAERQFLLARVLRRRGQVIPDIDRTGQIEPQDILVFSTIRNERSRLPFFLDYYRRLGVRHFLILDNDSSDGSAAWLRRQNDVSLWRSSASYKAARFGMDWMNLLLMRHGHGHWCLTVDPDEFLVYPHCDSRGLRALTGWLDARGTRSFPAMLLDTYPKGPIDARPYAEGEDPFAIAGWFDPANYLIRKNPAYGNLWIQGGPRARSLFAQDPWSAPALNKIPLVKWHWRYVYVSSTHMLLPRALNLVYDEDGGEAASGCLLHAKFLSSFAEKAAEELDRRQHYADGREYEAYHAGLDRGLDLWCPQSRAYEGWRQLEELGLISRGDWA